MQNQQNTTPPNISPAVRALGTVVGAIIIYTIASAVVPGGSGTFRSESKQTRSALVADPEEDGDDNLWGANTRGTHPSADRTAIAKARARAEARRSSETLSDDSGPRSGTPMYDAGRDGGWGSN
ncbi:MAG: hypothetical protein ACKOPG_00760 [Novosphingobium sp.]